MLVHRTDNFRLIIVSGVSFVLSGLNYWVPRMATTVRPFITINCANSVLYSSQKLRSI